MTCAGEDTGRQNGIKYTRRVGNGQQPKRPKGRGRSTSKRRTRVARKAEY